MSCPRLLAPAVLLACLYPSTVFAQIYPQKIYFVASPTVSHSQSTAAFVQPQRSGVRLVPRNSNRIYVGSSSASFAPLRVAQRQLIQPQPVVLQSAQAVPVSAFYQQASGQRQVLVRPAGLSSMVVAPLPANVRPQQLSVASFVPQSHGVMSLQSQLVPVYLIRTAPAMVQPNFTNPCGPPTQIIRPTPDPGVPGGGGGGFGDPGAGGGGGGGFDDPGAGTGGGREGF